ncbi:hypothetical protein [Paraburkholderia ferrariae]|uniref:hypothetical protein n=1 Tax=Paraburkholderia ferrariae TaxID=386056 RepID=UPI0012EC0C61|nr:hypothetical protein [Paraburkholderia ferrariae]
MKNITVRIGEPVDSISDATWDGRGNSIMCHVRYIAASPPKTPALSENLDRQFNIAEQNYILAGGFFSMALDPQKRIVDWSIYTNPNRWIRGKRDFEDTVPATAHIDADFDENGRAYLEEPTEFYEPIRGVFYLSWAESSTWYEIAPGVALGVTNEGLLAQLRIDGLAMPKVERLNLWQRLRQLL